MERRIWPADHHCYDVLHCVAAQIPILDLTEIYAAPTSEVIL